MESHLSYRVFKRPMMLFILVSLVFSKKVTVRYKDPAQDPLEDDKTLSGVVISLEKLEKTEERKRWKLVLASGDNKYEMRLGEKKDYISIIS